MDTSAEQLARRFSEALTLMERDGTLEPLLALYGDDAVVGNVLEAIPLRGKEGARSFWTMYRNTFQKVHSSLRTMIVGEDRAALEWTCRATGRKGQPVDYDGVTILEFRNGQISRSWAYFDAAGLGAQLKEPEIVPFDPGA